MFIYTYIYIQKRACALFCFFVVCLSVRICVYIILQIHRSECYCARSFMITLLLLTICMRSQLSGRISGVAVLKSAWALPMPTNRSGATLLHPTCCQWALAPIWHVYLFPANTHTHCHWGSRVHRCLLVLRILPDESKLVNILAKRTIASGSAFIYIYIYIYIYEGRNNSQCLWAGPGMHPRANTSPQSRLFNKKYTQDRKKGNLKIVALKMGAQHPLSLVIMLGVRHPRKKEKKK